MTGDVTQAPVQRVVVRGAAGGEGASTVVSLLARGAGLAVRVTARADDPAAVRSSDADTSRALVVADPGPHGIDETGRAGDVAVFVCAANTAAIERGKRLLADAAERGLTVAALIVSARSAAENRRGRVRMQQVAASDSRVVLLPFDPALSGSAASGAGAPATETRAALEKLRARLGL